MTGIADARTRKALGPLGRPLFGARSLRRGEFGWDVAVLQFMLLRQGINVPVNAYFDGPTLRGVRLLQHRMHLRRDGVVGPHTLASIVRREPVPLARPIAIATTTRARHATHHRRLLVHVVRSGDSLTLLARRYHTTVAKLAKLNQLGSSNYLLIGTKLRVPAAGHVTTVQRVAYRTSSVASVRAPASTTGPCTTA